MLKRLRQLNPCRRPLIVRRYTHADGYTVIELRQPLVVVLLGVALLAYILWPVAETAMLLVALAGLLLTAWLWAWTLARGVHAERKLRYAAVQVGDEIEEQLTLTNASWLPAWAEVVDESNLPGYALASAQAADPQAERRWRVKGMCSRRGVFALGPWELRMADPFRVFAVRQTYTQHEELVVYPPLAQLPGQLQPRSATLGDSRMLRQPLRAETINAVSARAYVPGDPLRHLHWRTTARRGAPFVKVFEPEATSTFWLIPDFDSAAQTGNGEDGTEETLVLLTVALAAQLLRQHLSVGLIAYTDSLSVVRPQPGTAHLWPILRALASLHPYPRPITQTLAEVTPLLSPRSMTVVLSPTLDADWLSALQRFIRKDGGAELILLDRDSFIGAATGRADNAARSLTSHGLPTHVVRRGDVTPVLGAYGALRRWEFMTLGTGRIVVRQTPRSSTPSPVPPLLRNGGGSGRGPDA
ncbi:MAG: DUF58 domain-containing protein [Anaerolineales bacterium]